MTPFEHFFEHEVRKLEAAIRHEPGVYTCPEYSIAESSWDRKRAYLLWCALGRPDKRPDPARADAEIANLVHPRPVKRNDFEDLLG